MKAIKANNFVAINKDEVQFDLLLINRINTIWASIEIKATMSSINYLIQILGILIFN